MAKARGSSFSRRIGTSRMTRSKAFIIRARKKEQREQYRRAKAKARRLKEENESGADSPVKDKDTPPKTSGGSGSNYVKW